MTERNYGPDSPPEEVRAEVRQWLVAHWDPAMPTAEWLSCVVDGRWAVPRWPAAWFGRDFSDELARLVEQEFNRVGAPGSAQDQMNMHANTVLLYGSEGIKQDLIGPILRSHVRMCLLYSEPEAGSDLAGVQTRADAVDGGWRISGQKVWTSGAAEANYGFLIARTNWDVPKHEGITFFLFPMNQPGVEVRPIKQITGEADFNEVFIDNAFVPAGNVLGEVGRGWAVLSHALLLERLVMGDRSRLDRDSAAMAVTNYGNEEDLVGLARAYGCFGDPLIRDAIATVEALRAINKWNGLRAEAEARRTGKESPLTMLGKLAMSRILHTSAAVRTSIVGSQSMLDGPDNPDGDLANFVAFNAFMTSIGGGTDQVQRNIIGERLLGLAKEPDPSKGVPFREVRRGGTSAAH